MIAKKRRVFKPLQQVWSQKSVEFLSLYSRYHYYSTLLYSTLLYSTLLYSTLLYSTLLYSTLLYATLRFGPVQNCTDLYGPVRTSTALLYSNLLYSTVRTCTELYGPLRTYTDIYYSTLIYSTLLYEPVRTCMDLCGHLLLYSELLYSTVQTCMDLYGPVQTFTDIFYYTILYSNQKIVTGLHDSRCTQMCILIFALRSCYCLGSFVLQDLFQVSKYLLSRDKIWNFPWTFFLLAWYSLTPGPALNKTVYMQW